MLEFKHQSGFGDGTIAIEPSEITSVGVYRPYNPFTVIYGRGDTKWMVADDYADVVARVDAAKKALASEPRPKECTSIIEGNRCCLPTGHEGHHRLGMLQWATQLLSEKLARESAQDYKPPLQGDTPCANCYALAADWGRLGCNMPEGHRAKKAPAPRFIRDGGKDETVTVGEIVTPIANALDLDDVDKACDVLDDLFLDGSWGHELTEVRHGRLLKKDIRGLVVAAYQEGKKRGAK